MTSGVTHLESYGWDAFFSRQHEREACGEPCRVLRSTPRKVWLASSTGKVTASLRRNIDEVVVGDWVEVDLAARSVLRRLDRRNQLSRKRPGTEAEQQILAANFDTVFVVAGLDGDLNPRRLERYLVAIRESSAEAVVVLNKNDLCADARQRIEQLNQEGFDCKFVLTSAESGEGIADLSSLLAAGRTAVFVGSSGVGKSSLINALMEEQRQKTAPVRPTDGRGRHTTTHRELFLLPQGWLLIDLPGIREIQPWTAVNRVDEAFPEIVRSSAECRFRDCGHQHEPGCAVRLAVEQGEIAAERLESFLKLRDEQAELERKIEDRRSADQLHKQLRHVPPRRK